MIRKLLSAATVILGFAVAQAQADTGKLIRIGVTAGPYADILRYAGTLAAKEGIELRITEFTDYTQPNAALAQDDLDINNFQHQPYLDNQVAQRGYDIVSIAKSIIVPIGLYSSKVTRLDQIRDGASAAIPNDPSNGARALQLFEKAGLIKLKPGTGIKATVADIAENPRHLKIVELDAAQLPRSLADLDFSAVNLNYALNAGLDPKKALLLESADSNWNLVFAVRAKNKDNPLLKRFVEIYRSPEVKAYTEKQFNGTILTTW
ncbi:MetQ/NlpA family ABC transporter substrate-binding protein [Bradyrhizobium sp. U87765 SZCCT0131]|uniref:MetQ/NlpA family ABC transporter substrate-binding protein n=1 Tax=Bradyrhizobium sp. U87765 SZCCT0109 TaxID=2807656 RepID=UPI001BA99CF0|nr:MULTISPECIES: MetQ/NlpA family ABC transporter substrate-binding protein [unclassified Bradyrhizobium]MBR1221703.1 MetQ/NlpA family ABC transporter substrate-binding protein [Bradyrhizobium sp. U87765 SZCCT0131]MBR1264374.1 MetQ/NlpA family ABC transporter substrate-binding protein [Bradyrhizobium sp. U87765 SZCCT0134]MBR1304719.1 MetQ/NlpA family ABC transporter substrate-binding protein [Bradyrhizobium sp. U87765 SZCCT0110]MBR1322424.1 MetQ/NlpA family ABC transporter substrate-binding pro